MKQNIKNEVKTFENEKNRLYADFAGADMIEEWKKINTWEDLENGLYRIIFAIN